MASVFCRGCGKEIHETAPVCPHCGAPQPISAPVESGRNVFKLVALGTLWAVALFFASMILVGIVSGLLNQKDAAAAGQRAGELLAMPVLLLSIACAIGFTVKGWLPGTGKPKVQAPK